MNMAILNLSLVLVFLVNTLKSRVGTSAWEWDPFHVVDAITWIKFWLLFILFLLLSFVSIRVFPVNGNIIVEFNRFSVIHTVCFWPLVFFPEAVFWYIYPFIAMLFTFTSCMTEILRLVLQYTQAVLSLVPNLNIFITRTNSNIDQLGAIPQALPSINEPPQLDLEAGNDETGAATG